MMSARGLSCMRTYHSLISPVILSKPHSSRSLVMSAVSQRILISHQYPIHKRPLNTKHNQISHSNEFTSLLEQTGKKGMRVIWIGLVANIGLTLSKGVAGWIMNSASLLADATHSFSDLLSDFVTLYTFKMSRKPADPSYPYGYGKFETIGSLSVSALLIAAGVGIGAHSCDLLFSVFNESHFMTLSDTASAAVNSSIENTTSQSSLVDNKLFDFHSNNELDPNAAWFALGSVFVKEWLYRITLKAGKTERSDVLIANAWHHRSDAYTSIVALIAIGGSHMGLSLLDPLGGVIVSGMILKSGMNIMTQSTRELMDKSISESDLDNIRSILVDIKNKQQGNLMQFHSLRGRKFGPFHHIDLVLELNGEIALSEVKKVEDSIRRTIKEQCDYVQEVTVFVQIQQPH
ncbi:cation efflux family-domain-containing protein [Pilobolus umbonatus]|nr:cation efflux family-domain-containing protein [Pilobolus umbonatus]